MLELVNIDLRSRKKQYNKSQRLPFSNICVQKKQDTQTGLKQGVKSMTKFVISFRKLSLSLFFATLVTLSADQHVLYCISTQKGEGATKRNAFTLP